MVELLAGQDFQFADREVLFGLRLILLEFVVAEGILGNPFVAQAVEYEVAQTIHDGLGSVVAAAVCRLQEEAESVEKLVVHPLDGNILLRAALGEVLFQIAQQPFVLVRCPLGDTHADLRLPPLDVITQPRDQHHGVFERVEVTLFDLQGIGFETFGKQLAADVDDLDPEVVDSVVDLDGQFAFSHGPLLLLVPQLRITVALGVDFLSESAGCDACADRCLPVFLGPSLSHQEKDCKRLLSHGFENFEVNKTPTRKNYCDAKCSNSMYYALNREQWPGKALFWRACSLMPTRNREQGCFWQHLSL